MHSRNSTSVSDHVGVSFFESEMGSRAGGVHIGRHKKQGEVYSRRASMQVTVEYHQSGWYPRSNQSQPTNNEFLGRWKSQGALIAKGGRIGLVALDELRMFWHFFPCVS